jgi:subtilase family protein
VPLRFPRPVMPVIATGLAAVWVVAAGAPAFADQVRAQEWWLGTLHVRQAWQASRGTGITVAVLSDGVSGTQPDVAGAVTTGTDFTGTAQTSGQFFGQQGTAIASLIAGRGHGTGHASGILGVAPKSRILSVRVTLDPADTALDSATVGARLPDAIAAGIRYAVARHAKVIELPQDPGEPDPAVVAAIPIRRSPDGTMPTHPLQTAGITAAAGGSAAEKAAVAYALHKKVVLVAPAGDNAEGTDAVSFPAAYHGVISVGAFSQSFTRAPYSSHQPYVTLTAAGQGVMAAKADGSYADVNSTNAASAVVAGIAALIRSRYPDLTPAQVSRALTTSTVFKPSGGATAGSGAGTVDAQRALLAAAALAAPAGTRAGAGAQAFTKPAAPDASPVSSNALAPRILRAAAISAGVLIVLLLAVLCYSALARRRERRRSATTAQWATSAQSAYSPYGPADADKMLEFFAAPAGEPTGAAAPLPQFQAGQLTGAGFGSGQAAEPGGSGEASGAGGGSGVGAWVPLGGSARAASRAAVSGTPPWEPAAEPDSELPWAAAPSPVLGAASQATVPARPAASEASSIWPAAGGPAAATPADNHETTSAWESLARSPAASSAAGSFASAPAASAAAASAPAASAPAASPARAASAAPAPSDADAGWRDQSAAPAGEAAAEAPPEVLTPGSRRRRSSWAEGSAPRSPSGSNWDLPDSESEAAAPALADSGWPSGSDSFRTPAASAGGWKPPEGEARWEMPSSPASTPPSTEPSWPSTEPSWPSPDRGHSWDPAATDASSGSHAEPPEPDMHWLPAAASDQWTSAEPSGGWQPAARADQGEARWQQPGPAAGSAPSEPAAPASMTWDAAPASATWDAAPAAAGWQPAAEPSWQPAAEPQWGTAARDAQAWGSAAGDAPGWAAAAESSTAASTTAATAASTAAASSGADPEWESAAAGAQDWEAAAASTEAAAKAAASAPWEPAAEPPSWGSAESAPPTDDPGPPWRRSAWRPSDQTESFPAVSDD